LKPLKSENKLGNPILQRFVKLFPFGLIFVAIVGFIAALKLLSFAVAMSSLLYVIPILLAAVFLLIRKNDSTWPVVRTYINQIPFQHLFLIYILLYLISTITLISTSSRPFGYFLFTGLISATIFMQIICERAKWTDYLIILEIIAVSLNMVWGVDLKYPLYFGSTDTLGHLNLIEGILSSFHTFNFDPSYQNFPLYHIFIAMGSKLTGLSSITSLFVFMGLAWQIGIIICFLILQKLINSRKMALIGCLLFAFNTQEISYGVYPVTRSLAFVLLLCWLYLIINKKKPMYLILSVLMMWALILTHHVTVLFALPLLLFIYLCQKLVRTPSRNKLPLLPVIILFVSFFFYVFYVAAAFTNYEIPGWLHSIFTAKTEVVADLTTKHQLGSANGIIYYSFLFVYFFIGMGCILRSIKFTTRHLSLVGLALASLAFIIVFIPGPMDMLPQSKSALLYRFPLLVSPLIILMTTFGVVYLMNLEANSWRSLTRKIQIPVLSILLVGASVFYSMICGGNGRDYPYFVYPATTSSEYFTEQEMQSFSFIQKDADTALTLFGDYETIRNEYNFYDFSSKEVLKSANTHYITQEGYIIIRAAELQARGGLVFSEIGSTEAGRFRYYGTVSDIIAQQAYANNIYNNKNVYIYYVDPNESQ